VDNVPDSTASVLGAVKKNYKRRLQNLEMRGIYGMQYRQLSSTGGVWRVENEDKFSVREREMGFGYRKSTVLADTE
jgi:hypothetical protein